MCLYICICIYINIYIYIYICGGDHCPPTDDFNVFVIKWACWYFHVSGIVSRPLI